MKKATEQTLMCFEKNRNFAGEHAYPFNAKIDPDDQLNLLGGTSQSSKTR